MPPRWLARFIPGTGGDGRAAGRRNPEAPAHASHAQPPEAATDRDRAHMERALALAEQAASMGEVPVGAVVYRTKTGEVLAEAHNRREADADPSAHAEFIAITRAARAIGDWRLAGCSLAVTLEPCPMCAGLIVNARLDRLIYGAADPRAGACQSLYAITDDPRLNHSPAVIAGVGAEPAGELLRRFFRDLRARGRETGAPGDAG